MQREMASKKRSKDFQSNAFYSNQDDDCKYFAKQDCSSYAFCFYQTFAICLQLKSINIWRLFISLPFYLVSSSSLSSSTLGGRLCMCLQSYLIFLLRSPTSSQPSLSFNDFVLVLCGRWFLFFQLFHVSVEIHIFITIIINSYGLFVILQFYLIFLL